MTERPEFRFLPEPPCMMLVDKPVGMSSAHIVAIARRLLRTKKVGHGGTLDPFASGLLPILVGREFTRDADTLLLGDKEYLMTVRFGSETDTGDLTGAVVAVGDGTVPDRDSIVAVLNRFIGEIEQEPPVYSALKHEGKPLYWYARNGNPVTKAARTVKIHSIDFVEMLGPDAVFAVKCGKGAYMRSLGRDIGRALSCPAHLVGLRRTAVGAFRVEDAWPLWMLYRAERRPVVQTADSDGGEPSGFPVSESDSVSGSVGSVGADETVVGAAAGKAGGEPAGSTGAETVVGAAAGEHT